MKKSLLPFFSAIVLVFISVFFLSFLCSTSFSQEVQKNQPAVSSKKTDSSQVKNNSLGSDAQGSPKIYFPETTHDFGVVSQGLKVAHKFKVQNTGDAPLKLIRAKGSWGCTAAVLTQAAIPPGGEGEIEVTFNSAHKKGKQQKTISVTSNDPTNSNAKLLITANVEIDFGFERSSLKIDNLKKGQGVTKKVYLFAKDIQNTRIDSIVSSSPFITAHLTDNPVQLAENNFELEITLSPDFPVGRVNETVTVYSNRETNGTAELRIYGEVVGDIEVRPSSFNFVFSDKKTENSPKKISVINHRDDLPMKIERITDTQDMLVFETDVLKEGKEVEILARPMDKFITEKGRFPGNIIIETNNPEQKSVSVNYIVIVN